MDGLFRQLEAAALLGEDERAFAAKLGRHGAFRKLGIKRDGGRWFDEGEVFFLALVGAVSGQNRSISEAAEAVEGAVGPALGLMKLAAKLSKGEIGKPGCDLYAIELRDMDGTVSSMHCETPDELAAVVRQAAIDHAEITTVINVTRVMDRIIFAGQIIRVGAPAARERVEELLALEPSAEHRARLRAWYAEIEDALRGAWPARKISPFDASYQPREREVA